MAETLIELDALEILVIVDNEVDPMSSYVPPGLQVAGQISDGARHMRLADPAARGGAGFEARMDRVCCGAHGLSLMITAIKGATRRVVLFDTAPEEMIWELNAKRLDADIAAIEWIQLSHWHRDHSGGMLRAVQMIVEAKRSGSPEDTAAVTVDLHPDRPTYRGWRSPEGPVSMEANPGFEEVEAAGGRVVRSDQPHGILDGRFLVSGEIPRVTSYEEGFRGGVRYNEAENRWDEDELILDERLLMCKLKNKGIVVFTGCSHAGVVNTAKHALELAGQDVPLYAVVGGFHLVGRNEPLIPETVRDLAALDPKLLMPGHCSGWRAKFEIERVMPGRLAPSTVGTRFTL